MHRRRFLALLGGAAAAAGCSAPEAGVGTEPSTLTPVEVPSTPQPDAPIQPRGGFGEASVVNLKSGPRTLALSPLRYARGGVRVDLRFTATATVTHPARLALTLTNESDATKQVDPAAFPPVGTALTRRWTGPGSTGSDSTDSGSTPDAAAQDASPDRLLVPTGGGDLGSARSGYERGPEGYWRATASPPTLPDGIDVEPEETLTGAFILLGAPGATGFPRGRYAPDAAAGTLSLAVWDTGAPGPRGESRFAGLAVPDLPNTDGTDWFHEATLQTGIFLRPATERGGSPTRFRFTLVNHSIDPLGGNPDEWKLYKLVDGRWYRIAPWTIDLVAGAIPSGSTFEYVVAASNGSRPACECPQTGGAVGRLGGGLYALEAGYSRVRTSETYAALFRFDAPDVRVDASGESTVAASGDRTVVTRPEWGDGTGSPDATMTVTRTETTAAPRVVPEQVHRRPYRALRDVVPYLSATPVVLRADASVVDEFLGKGLTHRSFTYEDEAYVATRGDFAGDPESTATR